MLNFRIVTILATMIIVTVIGLACDSSSTSPQDMEMRPSTPPDLHAAPTPTRTILPEPTSVRELETVVKSYGAEIDIAGKKVKLPGDAYLSADRRAHRSK